LALRRFFARRAISSIFYSDNAQTFQCAKKYLRSLQADPSVSDWLADNRVEWRFSPSLGPWWGGFWERMVRSVKELLRKTFGRRALDYDQLQTAITEIEGKINDRPLTYTAEGIDEPYPLTPSILVTGRRTTTPPSKPAPRLTPDSSARAALIDRDKHRKSLVSDWFKSWRTDYLEDLMRFHSKGKSGRAIQRGDVVVIPNANEKRLMWSSGVVVDLLPGRDGRVRAAKVRIPGGAILERAIRCLYPTEVQEEPEEEGEDEEQQPNQPQRQAQQLPETQAQQLTDSDVSSSGGEDVGNYTLPTRATTRGRAVILPRRYADDR